MKICWNHHLLSRSMMRVETAVKQYSPSGVQWVDDWREADLIIEHFIGRDPHMEERIALKPYALYFHCSDQPRFFREHHEYYQRMIGGARWVYSFLPLEDEGFSGNIILGPNGVDCDLFVPPKTSMPRTNIVLTTGYVASSERIDAMVEASGRIGKRMIHIGGDLIQDFGKDVGSFPHVTRMADISDQELVDLYGRTLYVSGLRRGEGFELPVLEGMLCGARPICFDTSMYRRWFDGLAIFVPELETSDLADVLVGIFQGPYKPVTQVERDFIAMRYGWETVARQFWRGLSN